jgi:antitoxin VapB
MHKDGGRLIIEPVPPRSLLALLATLRPIEDEFPPIDDQPADTVDF